MKKLFTALFTIICCALAIQLAFGSTATVEKLSITNSGLVALTKDGSKSINIAAKSDGFAVGSVQQSMLNVEDFQTEMGSTDWVLCDGSVVPTSAKLHKYMTVLPDATGRFLRSSGGSAATIRTLQNDSTAPNGLQANVQNHTHTDNFSVSGDATFSTSDSGVEDSGRFPRSGAGGQEGYIDRDFTWSGTINGSVTGGGAHTATVTSSNGTTETRPINITVNTFIKIN